MRPMLLVTFALYFELAFRNGDGSIPSCADLMK
jgi:hypothetical protein